MTASLTAPLTVVLICCLWVLGNLLLVALMVRRRRAAVGVVPRGVVPAPRRDRDGRPAAGRAPRVLGDAD